ncbi:hypothetical protein FRB90_002501, partial [Tulasnella sp. 427]
MISSAPGHPSVQNLNDPPPPMNVHGDLDGVCDANEVLIHTNYTHIYPRKDILNLLNEFPLNELFFSSSSSLRQPLVVVTLPKPSPIIIPIIIIMSTYVDESYTIAALDANARLHLAVSYSYDSYDGGMYERYCPDAEYADLGMGYHPPEVNWWSSNRETKMAGFTFENSAWYRKMLDKASTEAATPSVNSTVEDAPAAPTASTAEPDAPQDTEAPTASPGVSSTVEATTAAPAASTIEPDAPQSVEASSDTTTDAADDIKLDSGKQEAAPKDSTTTVEQPALAADSTLPQVTEDPDAVASAAVEEPLVVRDASNLTYGSWIPACMDTVVNPDPRFTYNYPINWLTYSRLGKRRSDYAVGKSGRVRGL